MAAIYKASLRVLVWLGRHTLSPESAWAHEIFVPALVNAISNDQKVVTGCTFELEDPKVVAAAGDKNVARWRAAYPGLFNFFAQTRWFGRGWIVQEVLRKESPGDVTMLCGSGALRFDYFLGFLMIMSVYTRFGTGYELGKTLYILDQEGSGEGSVKGSKRWGRVPSPLDVLDAPRKVQRTMRARPPAPYGMTKWQRVMKIIADMNG